ncbi:FAD-binding oxidoreductase [Candidatus Saccharibacteria bacterium]|nr:FAD-binding oxidoreductase [Candidatus Saccharibacteria bacterium]
MSKVAQYLEEHIHGEVFSTPAIRKYFSTDGSVFKVIPALAVYPRNESDVRKTTKFTWQLAERGRVIPITARGLGTDQSGAAIGNGVVMVFPAHMNRILEFDGKSGEIVVEPGLNYGKMQQTLHTHGRFLPAYPSSIEFSSIGGAVANNASGEKSYKYGSTKEFTKALRVVLANGDVIETRRLSKRELNKKMGLATFEGEVYRAVDALIEENKQIIDNAILPVSKNVAGYALSEVKRKDGSFDLTPLFVGSQGTLGVITEITLKTALFNPETSLIAAFFDDLALAERVLDEISSLSDGPSAIEVVDENLLKFVKTHNPSRLKGIVDDPTPKLVALIEFDSGNSRSQKRITKKVGKILTKAGVDFRLENDEYEKERLWKIRQVASSVVSYDEGGVRSLPIIDDAIVPKDKLQQYIKNIYAIFKNYNLQPAIWGHGGDAHLHVRPFFDLSQVGDRQKVIKIIDEYYGMVIALGGSTSGQLGDGRLRAPYLARLYGSAMYQVFQKLKQIFDPYSTLNPGVKIDVSTNDIKPLLRHEYSIDHLLHNLPRT